MGTKTHLVHLGVHKKMNSADCYYRAAGWCWILYGTAGCFYYLSRDRIVLLPLAVCILLTISGWGLLTHKRWSRIASGLLIAPTVLLLLDALAMSAFHRRYDALFFAGCTGVIAGVYTLTIVIVKR